MSGIALLVLAAALLACSPCACTQRAPKAPRAAHPEPPAPAPKDGRLFANATTSAELANAVASVRHVVVVEHIDTLTAGGTGSPVFELPANLKSIRGACSQADESWLPDISRSRQQQCVVVGTAPLIEFKKSGGGSGGRSPVVAWLSDLYLLVGAEPQASPDILKVNGGAAWLTHITFDAGDHEAVAVKAEPDFKQAFLYARSCVFQNFWNSENALFDLTSTAAAIAQSTFSNNTLPAVEVDMEHYIVVRLPSAGAQAGSFPPSNLWIQNSEFIYNRGLRAESEETVSDASPAFEVDTRSKVFSNLFGASTIASVDGRETVQEPTAPGEGAFSIAAYWLEDRKEFKGIVAEQAKVTGLQPHVITPLHADPEPFPKVEPHPCTPIRLHHKEKHWMKTSLVLVVLASALVVFVVALVVVLVVRWRRVITLDDPDLKRDRKAILGSQFESFRSESGTRNRVLAVRSIQASPGSSSRDGTSMPRYERMRSTLSTYLHDPAEALENTLDDMHEHEELFLGLYQLHNTVRRRKGDQGVVQFVRRAKDRREFIVKFFTDKTAFDREATLCQLPGLEYVMPCVHDMNENEDGLLKSSNGVAFPPFTIVDRGESLNEWVARVEPDYITSMFVLCHVAKRLQLLHAADMSHRDIKPSNLLWQPMDNTWKLLDLGCAAEHGKPTELNFSAGYAAPEVIAAWEAGEPTIIAEAAVDIWALGVVAFELLTGSHVFEPGMKNEDMYARISGREPMLWEDPVKAPPLLNRLGALKRSIRQCLERDPRKRPTADALLHAWNGVFDLKVNGQSASTGIGSKGPFNITGSTASANTQGSAYWSAASLKLTNGPHHNTASHSIQHTGSSVNSSCTSLSGMGLSGVSLSVKDWAVRMPNRDRSGHSSGTGQG